MKNGPDAPVFKFAADGTVTIEGETFHPDAKALQFVKEHVASLLDRKFPGLSPRRQAELRSRFISAAKELCREHETPKHVMRRFAVDAQRR